MPCIHRRNRELSAVGMNDHHRCALITRSKPISLGSWRVEIERRQRGHQFFAMKMTFSQGHRRNIEARDAERVLVAKSIGQRSRMSAACRAVGLEMCAVTDMGRDGTGACRAIARNPLLSTAFELSRNLYTSRFTAAGRSRVRKHRESTPQWRARRTRNRPRSPPRSPQKGP